MVTQVGRGVFLEDQIRPLSPGLASMSSILGTFYIRLHGKGKGRYTWYSASSWIIISEALRYGTCSQGISQFYLHTHTFIRNRNEPYLPLPSQLYLVLICRPRKDGRLSWPVWLVTRRDSLPAQRQSPIPLLAGLNVEQLRWSRPARYRYTKPPQTTTKFCMVIELDERKFSHGSTTSYPCQN